MIRDFSLVDVTFIVLAARWTILLSILAFIGGGVGGIVVALSRVSTNVIVRSVASGFILFFQGTPLLVQLFLVFFGLPLLGVDVSPWLAAGVAMMLHASAFLGDIWRGCLQAVPGGQYEASLALGMSRPRTMLDVIVPQATKIALAPTVGFLVQLVKSTSLTALIGFVELTRSAQIVNSSTYQPIYAFGLVALLYFSLCWPLSKYSSQLEEKYRIS